MLKAESIIAIALMGLSLYFMVYAVALPIGWVPENGPGGGAFPFWLSLGMLLCSGGILLKSLRKPAGGEPFFDPETRAAVLKVSVAIIVAIAAMSWLGAYVALAGLMVWYLRFFGGHTWRLTGILTVSALLFLFFFFEVTLKILLPKGVTEPLFLPLYAIFF